MCLDALTDYVNASVSDDNHSSGKQDKYILNSTNA